MLHCKVHVAYMAIQHPFVLERSPASHPYGHLRAVHDVWSRAGVPGMLRSASLRVKTNKLCVLFKDKRKPTNDTNKKKLTRRRKP